MKRPAGGGFVCRPAAWPREPACASKILFHHRVRRAFRREVGPSDVKPFLAQFESARRKHSFDASIAAALASLLLAPDFLFRLEFDPPGAAPGSAQRVSQSELASRLSFFLSASIPDDELLGAAQSGKLRRKATLDAQVRRMLAAPAAAAMFDNFAGQWLGLRALAEAKPDQMAFPDFDGALAAAFEEETRLFVGSILRENRSVLDLLAADYTYLTKAGAVVRNSRCHRTRLPPRFISRRSRARRTPGAGQHPAAHLAQNHHVADSPRQVDS
jgi:hypothetical protein